jgi:hypothetical protein
VTKIESDYDTGWREGYEAASGAGIAEIERLRAEVELHWTNLGLAAEANERLRAALAEIAGCPEWMAAGKAREALRPLSSPKPGSNQGLA